MEKLVAAVVECDKPPQIKAALLQHIACGIPKQSDDEAITFFRICFRWRVFGPHSYRRPASDLLERLLLRGPAFLIKVLPAALEEGVDRIQNGGDEISSDDRDGGCACGHLIDTMSAVAYGVPQAGRSTTPSPGGVTDKTSQLPSGVQWDLSKMFGLLSCAVKNAEGLTRSQQARLARLLVRDGLWPLMLRAAASSGDAEHATTEFKQAIISWLACMSRASAEQDKCAATATGRAGEPCFAGIAEASELAPDVWEEGTALVRCLKTGWKRTGGIGEREAQETLEMTFRVYAERPRPPSPALALILLDWPTESISRCAQRFAGAPLPDSGLAKALACLLQVRMTPSIGRWAAHLVAALYLVHRPGPVVEALDVDQTVEALVRGLCADAEERWGAVLAVLQPALLGDGASAEALRRMLQALVRLLMRSALAMRLLAQPPPPPSTATPAPGAPKLTSAPTENGIEEGDAAAGPIFETVVHASVPSWGQSFGLRLVGVDVPTRVARLAPIRWSVSICRTCDYAPHSVCLQVKNIQPPPPPLPLQGSLEGGVAGEAGSSSSAGGAVPRLARSPAVSLGAVGEEAVVSVLVPEGLDEVGAHQMLLQIIAVTHAEEGVCIAFPPACCQVAEVAVPSGAGGAAAAQAALERRVHDVYRSPGSGVAVAVVAEGEGAHGEPSERASQVSRLVESVREDAMAVEMSGAEARSTASCAEAPKSRQGCGTDAGGYAHDMEADSSESGLLPEVDVMKSVDGLRQVCLLLHCLLQAHWDDKELADLLGPTLSKLSMLRPCHTQIQTLCSQVFSTYVAMKGTGGGAKNVGGSTRAGGPSAASMATASVSAGDVGSGKVRSGGLGADSKHPLGCGLINLGNTCYMSAYLQVLVRVPAFTVALLRLPTAGSWESSQGAKGQALASATAEAAEDKVVSELQRVTATLLLSVRPSVQPQTLLSALPAFFQGGCQQDAHEFGRYLLSCVQSRSERLDKRAQAGAAAASAGAGPLAQPQLRGKKCDPTGVFQGKMLTRVTCHSCATRSYRSEIFNDLSIPLPTTVHRPTPERVGRAATGGGLATTGEERAATMASQKTGNGERGHSAEERKEDKQAHAEESREDQVGALVLAELVEQMLEAEEMTGSEQYWCEVCGGKRDALRESFLESLPEIAQLTLLRFSDTSARTKVCRKVEIPSSILLPHCPLRGAAKSGERDEAVDAGGAGSRNEAGRSDVESDVRVGDGVGERRRFAGVEEGRVENQADGERDAEEEAVHQVVRHHKSYDLFAVVTHAGKSTNSGHYYAFVRHPGRGCWLQCDDSSVSNSSFERAVTPRTDSETPYLLFFVRADGGFTKPAAGGDAQEEAAAIDAVPAALRAEVEADNRTARETAAATPVSVGARPWWGPDGGGGGRGGEGGFDGAGGGPGLGPSWGMA